MASGADIVAVSVGKEHDLCYWNFHPVASKDEEKVGKDSRGKETMKLKEAAKKAEDGIEETLTYCDFPSEH